MAITVVVVLLYLDENSFLELLGYDKKKRLKEENSRSS